jgi:hypothetical protein
VGKVGKGVGKDFRNLAPHWDKIASYTDFFGLLQFSEK